MIWNSKYFIFFACFLSTRMMSAAQSKNDSGLDDGKVKCDSVHFGIRAIHAFWAIHIPGNIPVDPESGRPLYHGPDTLNTVYIETGAGVQGIQWEAAWKNNRIYSITVILISKPSLEIGTRKADNQKVILTPAKGNKLWRLELTPLFPGSEGPAKPEGAYPMPPEKLRPGEILLRGKCGKKTFFQKIGSQVELVLPRSV